MPTLLKAQAHRPATHQPPPPAIRPALSAGARKEIDFTQAYETGLAAVRSLPSNRNLPHQDRKGADEVTKVFRDLYEAANGREVATPIGPIAIAPAVAPWLKDAPLSFETQEQ